MSQLCLSAAPPAATCTCPHSPSHRTISLLKVMEKFPDSSLPSYTPLSLQIFPWSHKASEQEGLSPGQPMHMVACHGHASAQPANYPFSTQGSFPLYAAVTQGLNKNKNSISCCLEIALQIKMQILVSVCFILG